MREVAEVVQAHHPGLPFFCLIGTFHQGLPSARSFLSFATTSGSRASIFLRMSPWIVSPAWRAATRKAGVHRSPGTPR
jgi:hypothetical protein